MASVNVGAATGVVVPLAAQNTAAPQSSNAPLSLPGGAVKTLDDGKPAATFAQGVGRAPVTQSSLGPLATNSAQAFRPANRFISRLGGTLPLTAASGSGALTHNGRAVQAGQRGVQAVFAADAVAAGVKLIAQTPSPRLVSGDALRTFAFARVMSHQE